jgi:hypothetical protein
MGSFEEPRDETYRSHQGPEHGFESKGARDIERVYALLESKQPLGAVLDSAMSLIKKIDHRPERSNEDPLATLSEPPNALALERHALRPAVGAIGHSSDELNSFPANPDPALPKPLPHLGRSVLRPMRLIFMTAVAAATIGFGFLPRAGTHEETHLVSFSAPYLPSTASETDPVPHLEPAPTVQNQTVFAVAATLEGPVRDAVQSTHPPEGVQDESRARSPGLSLLLRRGDSLLAAGDVASARLFYERAADAGDAQGALKLGEAYDPLFLTRINSIGVRGDITIAARWYRRAAELGASEAELLLKSVGKQ